MARINKRVAGIVVKDGQVLLMHRFKNGEEYWVFPGGGQEDGETLEETVVREIEEETSIQVRPIKLLYKISWDIEGENYFYLCEYLSGTPELRVDSEEYQKMQGGEQSYIPCWVDISEVPKLTLYQLEIRDLFLEDHAKGFSEPMKHLSIKFSERRQ